MPQADAPISNDAKQELCPCGSKLTLANCCLPLLDGQHYAQTAEQLMRSRYSAHALLQINYLWQTWIPEIRQRSTPEQIRGWASSCEWLSLQILDTEQGQATHDQGTVTFIALYQHQGELQRHLEKSTFRRVLGRWFYEDHCED